MIPHSHIVDSPAVRNGAHSTVARPRYTHSDEWVRVTASGETADPVPLVLDDLLARMDACEYPPHAMFAVRLSLDEAAANARKHGNECDDSKSVIVRYRVTAERVFVSVEDQGTGFDPHDVPDPRQPENLGLPCGRGVMLMREYMDEITWNSAGNRVLMIRYRATP